MNGYPIIKVTLDGVRHSIVQHLGMALEQDKAYLEKEISHQLGDLDIQRLVAATIKEVAPSIIRDTISSAIKSMVSDALWSDDSKVKGLMREAVSDAIHQALGDR